MDPTSQAEQARSIDLSKVMVRVKNMNELGLESLDLEFGHDDNLWFLKTKIIDNGSFGTSFRLFYENEEIEVDESLPMSQVFDVEKQPIEIKALLPKAAQILVRNQKVNCKLLVGKGENMKIFEPTTGSAEPVTLEPVGKTRFPVELRVITDHDEITRSEEGVGLDWNTLIVRRYLINECDEVTILASGDIEYNEVQFGLVQLNVKSGGTVEKFCKTKKPIGLSLPRFYASALSKAAAALEKLTRYPLDNYKNQKYGKIKDGPIPIESTPVSGYIESEPEVKFWDREKKMVQNAFICSQAAYKPKPEAYIRSIKTRFTNAEIVTLPGVKQKCLLVYCKNTATLYISFRGSVDLDDWLVNLDTDMVKLNDFLSLEEDEEEIFGPDVKCHQGFSQRAKLWVEELIPKIERYENLYPGYGLKRICTTGHSLGAATSALVHILLVARFDLEEIFNVTFALPLFGNLALKNHLQSIDASEHFKNMFHFVNYTDLVPAVALMPHVYKNLSHAIGGIISYPSFLTFFFMSIGTIRPETSEEKKKIKQIATELEKELAMNKGNFDPLFENISPETYMPIGNYIIMKDSDMHEFSFDEGFDHQWIGQILAESLKILKRLHSKHFVTGGYTGENKQVIGEILNNHSLETYGSQMTGCLTNGVHENFMWWKMETDLGH